MFHMKVESFNVEMTDATDSSTVAAVAAPDADVLMLQETTPSWEQVLRDEYGGSYPHMLFRVKGESSPGGLAVLSRYPLTDLGYHPGPFGWHPAWHVRADTPAGPVQLLNVHLRSATRGRSTQVSSFLNVGEDHVSEIEDFVGECDGSLPTIVAGDFNESEDGEAIGFLENRGFTNILPLYHPGQPTWRYASVGGQFVQTIDHILFDERFLPLNARVFRRGNSDHLPVYAHVEQAYHWITAAPPTW